MMSERDESNFSVNPGYANWQLAKALRTAESSDNTETRDRALARAEKWQQVFNNIASGSVNYGSRTPIKDVPVWATPEVVTGGFVTGGLLAGGPLQSHEKEIARSAGLSTSEGNLRRSLNLWFVTDHGLAALNDMLRSGKYKVQVPEEAALLTVALLLDDGDTNGARALLVEIGRYFDKLRFFPEPSESVTTTGIDVYRWSVGETAESLSERQRNKQIDTQRESISIWAPLLDRMVDLLSHTVDTDGSARSISEEWKQQAAVLIADIENAGRHHRLCRKPHHRKSNFFQLRSLLLQSLGASLSDKDTIRLCELIDRCLSKRGKPGSPKHQSIRMAQREQISAPSFYDLNRVVLARMEKLPKEDGIDDTASILSPVTETESTENVPADSRIPEVLVKKVERCHRDSVRNLVATGVLASADTLAEVLPQISSGVRSMGIRHPEARTLYSSTYRAFRKRRSLLLLNFEHQANIEELPWVSAMDGYREDSLASKDASLQTLRDVSLLTLSSFPQAIVPNKMLQELEALAKGANLELPFVNELAADIFMGDFSSKFLRSAKVAAELLEGSLYANYYGIDYPQVLSLPDANRKNWLLPRSDGNAHGENFAALVSKRAGVEPGNWNVAENGMLIEQQQILTTQNLAVLTMGIGIQNEITELSEELAQSCFYWICKRLQANAASRHDNLIAIKNSAYCWRQMLYFISMADVHAQDRFIKWCNTHLQQQHDAFITRFKPAIDGLNTAFHKHTPPPQIPNTAGAQFLGWTNQHHWLMPEKQERSSGFT